MDVRFLAFPEILCPATSAVYEAQYQKTINDELKKGTELVGSATLPLYNGTHGCRLPKNHSLRLRLFLRLHRDAR